MTDLKNLSQFQDLLYKLKKESLLSDFQIDTNVATVTIVGYAIKSDSNLSYEIIHHLSNDKIDIFAIMFSETKITILISDQNSDKVIKILHNLLFGKS